MDALGWVWPPALLGLLVWITIRIRRQLPRRGGRWMLYPVIAVTAIAAVGGSIHTVTQSIDQASAESAARAAHRRGRPPAVPVLQRIR